MTATNKMPKVKGRRKEQVWHHIWNCFNNLISPIGNVFLIFLANLQLVEMSSWMRLSLNEWIKYPIKREKYIVVAACYIHYRSAWLKARLTRRITVAALLQREARLVAELHRWPSHRQTYQHQELVKSTRVETSHWSRSVQILRSDWLRSLYYYASSLNP